MDERLPVGLRRREQVRDPLGRRRAPRARRPRCGHVEPSTCSPSARPFAPTSAQIERVVDRDHLRGERHALGAERRQPLRARRPRSRRRAAHRPGARRRRPPPSFSPPASRPCSRTPRRHASTTRRSRTRPASSARHPLGDLGAAFGDLQRLPAVVRVEAFLARRRRLAELRQERRALDRAVGERERARLEAAITAGRASTDRSQAPTETPSSRDASGCDHGSSGSTVAASSRRAARPARSRHGRRRRERPLGALDALEQVVGRRPCDAV